MATAVTSERRFAQPVRRALESSFFMHGALVFGATMATNMLNYMFNFAISRRLGVEGFASLSSLVSAIMILSIPAMIVTLIVVKYAASFHATHDTGRIRRLSVVLLRLSAGAALLVFAAGYLLKNAVAAFLNIPNDAAITLTFVVIAFGLITPTLRGVLQGEQDFMRYSASLVLESLLKVVLAVGLVYAGYHVQGAMFGWALGAACGLAYTVWAVLKKHQGAAEGVRLELDARRLIQTTVGVALATGFLTTISFVDVLLVKHYFDARQAGLYAAVNLTGKIVLFLVSFVPAIVLPKAVANAEHGESSLKLLWRAGVITLVLSGATLAVFGLLPSIVLRLIAGQAFVSGAPYVFQYDTAMVCLALLTLIVNYRIGVHRFEFLYGLGVILALEVGAIALWHAQLLQVIHILMIGNAIALVPGLYGIRGPAGRRATVASP